MSSLGLTVTLALIYAHSSGNVLLNSALAVDLLEKPFCIAQQFGGDPHGDDPHGGDPHDEIHDGGIPNRTLERGKPTDDVYGGIDKVSNSAHPLDNFPGKPGF